MQLSKNFQLVEFTRTTYLTKLSAVSQSMQRQPSADIIKNLQALAFKLQVIRDAYGKPIHINSGFRCKELNNMLPESAPNSAHIFGCAADVVIQSEDLNERIAFVKLAIQAGFTRIGLGKTYTHLDIAGQVFPGKYPNPAVWGYHTTPGALIAHKAEFLKSINDLNTKH